MQQRQCPQCVGSRSPQQAILTGLVVLRVVLSCRVFVAQSSGLEPAVTSSSLPPIKRIRIIRSRLASGSAFQAACTRTASRGSGAEWWGPRVLDAPYPFRSLARSQRIAGCSFHTLQLTLLLSAPLLRQSADSYDGTQALESTRSEDGGTLNHFTSFRPDVDAMVRVLASAFRVVCK